MNDLKRFWGFLLAGAMFYTSALTVQAAESGPPPAQLGQIVAAALADNPELKSDQARWEIFREKIRQAGTLEDPMLMLRLQNLLLRDPLAFDRDSTSAKVIGVTQTIPFYGKRGLAKEAANQEAEAARWNIEERKVELAFMVKESWSQLQFVDSYLETIAKNLAILDDLSRYSETLYSLGKGQQQDVLKAQLDRTKMEEMRITLKQKRRSLVATLNTLAHRPAEMSIVPDSPLELTPLAMSAAELEALAGENRPLLKVIAAREQKAKAMHGLASRELYPDFTFTFEYMQRNKSEMDKDGFDMYSTGVTFNLPLQHDRRQAMVAESAADSRMVGADREMALNSIRLGIADALAKLEGSRNMAGLYRQGIIPQANSIYEASLAAYRAGKAEFMGVLESRMAIINYERDYSEAVADHQMQLARLESVVGTNLPSGAREITAPVAGRQEQAIPQQDQK
ncbi:MAG: TolC family protein [Desulfobulbaceae bacterium]|nr:TolC family protein [Desulfobulbaceae bacterium]